MGHGELGTRLIAEALFYRNNLLVVKLYKLGITQAPLKKGGWGDLKCLEHYTFRYRCVSPTNI